MRAQIIDNFKGHPHSNKSLNEHMLEQRSLLLAIDMLEAVLMYNSNTAKALAREED